MSERVCPECGGEWSPRWRVIFHRFACSRHPDARDVDERAQDRERAALADLRAPVLVRDRCSLHESEPADDCRACEIAWEQRRESATEGI